MKKYLQMNGKIIGFNIDPEFNNCLDGLMLVNIADIPLDMFDDLTKEIENTKVIEQINEVFLS
jgi:hypothetical protein